MTSPLPSAVGTLSDGVCSLLANSVGGGPAPTLDELWEMNPGPFDHDAHLALYVLNELHYTGWAGVDDAWEWDSTVVRWRTALAEWFEHSLWAALGSELADPAAEVRRLLALDGPSTSRYLAEEGTLDQLVESMILRTPYHGKEADPHTFVIPRLSGSVKRALCDIQAGEYGVGHARSHAELFADALVDLGIDPTPNAHIDLCTGPSLATSNLVSLGALRRRLRGVVLGQLSLFEMDSVVPNGRMVECVDRLGCSDRVRWFFQVHVMADAEHEVQAERAFLIDYPQQEPVQVDNLLLGMRAQSLIDSHLAADLTARWSASSRPAVSAVR